MFKNRQLRKALEKAGIVSFERMWKHEPPAHYTGPMEWQIKQLERQVMELQKQVELLAEFLAVSFKDGNALVLKNHKLPIKAVFLPDAESPPRTIIS